MVQQVLGKGERSKPKRMSAFGAWFARHGVRSASDACALSVTMMTAMWQSFQPNPAARRAVSAGLIAKICCTAWVRAAAACPPPARQTQASAAAWRAREAGQAGRWSGWLVTQGRLVLGYTLPRIRRTLRRGRGEHAASLSLLTTTLRVWTKSEKPSLAKSGRGHWITGRVR